MANEIFISYCRKDYDQVSKIKKFLDNELGINCWMDTEVIESGSQFKNIIISAINQHNILLFMKSVNSMSSEFAMKELEFAESKKKRIVLVDLDRSPLTDKFLFDYGMKDNIDWQNDLQRDKLIRDLKSWIKSIDNSDVKKRGTNILQETENAEEWFNKGEENYSKMNYKEACKWFLKAAEQGHVMAQCELAFVYATGLGVPRNETEAFKWYRKAAEQGDAQAQCNLGSMYEDGIGTPQNKSEALKWYRKAAEQGNEIAKNIIKLM